MGVYIETFRTAHKIAMVGTIAAPVYAYRYLCRLNDAEPGWTGRDDKRVRLLRSNIERAATLFDEKHPAYAAHVYEDDWEGAYVYANPTSAVWYDCDAFPGKLVGFMAKHGRGWRVTNRRQSHNKPIVAGVTWLRECTQVVEGGEIHEENVSYVRDGVRVTVEEFTKWRDIAVPAYVEEQNKLLAEQQRQNDLIAAERANKQREIDKQIETKRRELEELQRARASV